MNISELEDQVIELVEWRNRHFFGKYPAVVESVKEGNDLGMISVKMEEAFEGEHVLENVKPCSPFAGDKHGFVAIPEKGDGVWIEFAGGNTSSPIWSGFWWKDKAMPEPKDKLIRSFITSKGHKLLLDDKDSKVTLLHAKGAEITMTDSDITIKIGDSTVKMTKSEITLAAGAVSPQPNIKISASEIVIAASTTSTVKLTSGGVDIMNGALKLGV